MIETLNALIDKNKLRFTIFLCGLFIADCLILSYILFPQSKKTSAHFLDVGQADAELVRASSGATFLFDTGSPDGAILGALAKEFFGGAQSIDLVLISHAEADHMGGMISLLENYRIGAVLYSGRDGESKLWFNIKDQLERRGIPLIPVIRGDLIKTDGVNFSVLSPDKNLLRQKVMNESSLVVKMENDGVSTLFTGDIGSKGELFLKQLKIKADILKVAHHGSKFSTSESFIDSVDPKIAIIEVGKNSYEHPAVQTLDRLETAGVNFLRTDKDGTVSILFRGDGDVSVYKEK